MIRLLKYSNPLLTLKWNKLLDAPDIILKSQYTLNIQCSTTYHIQFTSQFEQTFIPFSLLETCIQLKMYFLLMIFSISFKRSNGFFHLLCIHVNLHSVLWKAYFNLIFRKILFLKGLLSAQVSLSSREPYSGIFLGWWWKFFSFIPITIVKIQGHISSIWSKMFFFLVSQISSSYSWHCMFFILTSSCKVQGGSGKSKLSQIHGCKISTNIIIRYLLFNKIFAELNMSLYVQQPGIVICCSRQMYTVQVKDDPIGTATQDGAITLM